jgi:hypothetical protein
MATETGAGTSPATRQVRPTGSLSAWEGMAR